eukprot:3585677-Pyramimonas_sp.AAC.1
MHIRRVVHCAFARQCPSAACQGVFGGRRGQCLGVLGRPVGHFEGVFRPRGLALELSWPVTEASSRKHSAGE